MCAVLGVRNIYNPSILASSWRVNEQQVSHSTDFLCHNQLLTKGTKISCRNKRKLILIYRNSNNSRIKSHYKRYCKILTDVIKLAKKTHYNNLLINSTNKTKTTWNIINENINKSSQKHDISFLNINSLKTHDSQVISNTINFQQ